MRTGIFIFMITAKAMDGKRAEDEQECSLLKVRAAL